MSTHDQTPLASHPLVSALSNGRASATRATLAGRLAGAAAATALFLGGPTLAMVTAAPAAACSDQRDASGAAVCVPIDRGDYDGDGMSNLAEDNYDTSMARPDSDFDGLTDPQEVHQYGTHPWKPDTDNDGSSDRYEIDGGTDPLVNNTVPRAAPPPPQAPPEVPAPAPEPAPEPKPAPALPCIFDPFDLNFPGAC